VAGRPKRLLLFLSSCTAILLLLLVTSGWWLAAMGSALIWDDGPGPADAAVVLAGDFTGHRIQGGARLLQQSLVPVVLVSGPPGMYGINEADAAIQFLARQGIPTERFVPVYHAGLSTREEARFLLAELARRGAKRADIVTSNYHTGRARRIYRKLEKELGGGPEIRMVAAPDASFEPGTWWHNREGQKIAFYEWIKVVTSAFGI